MSPGERKSPAPEPLSATRTKFQFSGDEEMVAMFKALQDRFRRKYPQGRIEDIVKESFKLLLEESDPAREPSRKIQPKVTKHTRRIPSAVKREVWRKDGARCSFVSECGVHCDGTAYLELDHVIPWSLGGSSRDADNLTVRCRAHNAWRGGARAG